MEYRNTWIRKVVWKGKAYYRAEHTPTGATLARYVATDDHPVGIMRAVDDWITTGRSQFRTTA